MQIVVNHLTRMRNGHICVAGIDLDSMQHVRPRTRERLTLDLAAQHGGVFGIGEIVDLGPVRFRGRSPEVEDYGCSIDRLSRVRTAPSEAFWTLLRLVAKRSLVEIFGTDLMADGRTRSVPSGLGRASLGCLAVSGSVNVFIIPGSTARLRIAVYDGGVELLLPLTDLRLHDARFSPDPWRVKVVNQRIKSGAPVILSVGLSRPFQRSGDDIPKHWLQVNNIHLGDGPLRGI